MTALATVPSPFQLEGKPKTNRLFAELGRQVRHEATREAGLLRHGKGLLGLGRNTPHRATQLNRQTFFFFGGLTQKHKNC